MLSSLGYAILAILAGKPSSGYDLARRMKPPQGYVWQAKHGQIYPELARLVAAGLVRYRQVDKSLGPPRRLHSITRSGRAELSRWVVNPPHARPMNDELVVKAYALRRVSDESARWLLDDQIRQHEHRLVALEQMSNALALDANDASDLDATRFGEYAVLRRAIGVERDFIAWCRWLLTKLSSARSKESRTTDGHRASARQSNPQASRKLRRA